MTAAPAVFRERLQAWLEFPQGWAASFITLALYFALQPFSWLKVSFSFFQAFSPLLTVLCMRAALLFMLRDIKVDENHRLARFAKKAVTAFEYIFVGLAIGYPTGLLLYIACAVNAPLADDLLNRLDLALGFDWLVWMAPFHAGGWLWKAANAVYFTTLPQITLVSVYFAFSGRVERIRETFWLLTLTLFVAGIISAFMPALGPSVVQGVDDFYRTRQPLLFESLQAMKAIHEKQVPVFPQISGIITFPSYHALASVLLIYAFRGTGWVGRLVLVLNVLVILATPFAGGHYLVDIIGGIALAGIAIFIARHIARRRAL